MHLRSSLMAVPVLFLAGCVGYDDSYRTTGRVGAGDYRTDRGERVYSDARLVEDRYGDVYRVYPDGTAVLIGRRATGAYGYGAYPNGVYSAYPYGGGYVGRPYGAYSNPYYGQPVYPSRPRQGHPLPGAGAPGVSPPTSRPPVADTMPPAPRTFRPRTESVMSPGERGALRRAARNDRELRNVDEP